MLRFLERWHVLVDASWAVMGAIYSAFLFSYALLMLPAGYLTDLWGPKVTLAVVGLGSGIPTVLTGFAATPGLGVLLGVVPL